MPRPNKPQYHTARNCWKFSFGGKMFYFGHEIPRGEKPQVGGVPQRAWDEMNARITRAKAPAVSGTVLTVLELCQYYLEWAERERDAGRMAQANLNGHTTHLGKFWEFHGYGARPSESMGVTDIEAFAQAMGSAGHSENYVANICRSIQAAFNWAARPVAGRKPVQMLDRNPMKGYRPPPIPVQERYIEADLAQKFLAWAWRRARKQSEAASRSDRVTLLMIRFIRMTGCRPGEACGLEWTDIDWKARVAVIPPKRHKTGRRTGKTREIHLTTRVYRLLEWLHRLDWRHDKFVFVHRPGKRGHATRDLEGEPWNSVALSAWVRKQRKAAIRDGLEIQDSGAGRLVVYIFRHTYATNVIRSGRTHAETAKLIGNTAQVTESTYTHIQRAHAAKWAQEAADKIREDH